MLLHSYSKNSEERQGNQSKSYKNNVLKTQKLPKLQIIFLEKKKKQTYQILVDDLHSLALAVS